MDLPLERGLRLHTEPKYKYSYKWAIIEIDAQGQQIGEDQVPLEVGAVYFTAASCVLLDSIDITSKHPFEEEPLAVREIKQRQVIQVKLRPGIRQIDGSYRNETTFSMFGTGRAIKNFDLTILAMHDPAEQESCGVVGSVEDDWIAFHFIVKPERFAGYVARVAHGLLDDVTFSVSTVDGFYSEYSSMAESTRNVKVLCGQWRKVTLPPGYQVEPPRLGHVVGDAQLSINRRLEFGKRSPEPEAVEEVANIETERAVPETPAPAAADPRMLQMLRSLRQAAWLLVGLLAAILVNLLRH